MILPSQKPAIISKLHQRSPPTTLYSANCRAFIPESPARNGATVRTIGMNLPMVIVTPP